MFFSKAMWRAVNAEKGKEFECLCLPFVLSPSLHRMGSIRYMAEPLILCALQKNVLQCPLEALRSISVSAGVNQFLCSSCWIEMKLSVKHRITNSKSFQQSEDNRRKKEDSHQFLSSYRYSHNPKCLCAWNTNTQALWTKTLTSTQNLHLSPTQGFSFSTSQVLIQFPPQEKQTHTSPRSPRSPN